MHLEFIIYHFNSETIYIPENEQKQNPDTCIHFERFYSLLSNILLPSVLLLCKNILLEFL